MSIPLQPEAITRVNFHDRLVALIAIIIGRQMERQRIGEFCRQLETWSERYPPADADMAKRYRNAVCAVSRRCRSQQGCLLRSLSTAAACRISHRSVTWCTGFTDRPFRAHAWVEVNGTPIGEPDAIGQYIITRSSSARKNQ
ncbi:MULTISPECIES: lasso peptide biosynthesis B2 protein [Bifidobacterium]|uniref:Lasso peptide biosynthesis B2 protein n=1 Tax=Bifidobacterium callitrichidarum TaxID=2052941 RepID=A0A2U2NBS5_9BIFI|nr:lasso peptide biosynthesis B2 protein [Bifidobacterium callitrichidarum]